jgi:hypothetical protein
MKDPPVGCLEKERNKYKNITYHPRETGKKERKMLSAKKGRK